MYQSIALHTIKTRSQTHSQYRCCTTRSVCKAIELIVDHYGWRTRLVIIITILVTITRHLVARTTNCSSLSSATPCRDPPHVGRRRWEHSARCRQASRSNLRPVHALHGPQMPHKISAPRAALPRAL